MAALSLIAALALGSSKALAQTTVSIPFSGASAVAVSSSFVNTGFELASFPLFAQTSTSDNSSNQYSINLLNALFSKSGGRPVLRVGGDTADGYVFDKSLTQPIYPTPSAPSTQPGTKRIGPNFWPLTSNLAAANPLWQPQLTYTNTTGSLTIQDAQAMASSIGTSNIIAVEIGNEPNEYGNHTGPSATSATHYSDRFQAIVSNVSSAFGVGSTTPFFAGPDLASYDFHTTDWSIETLFGSTDFDKTGNIKLATDHWYLSNGDTSIPDIMNHAKMVNYSASVAKAAQYFSTFTPHVDYVLDEFNVLNGGPDLTFSSSLGSALASVDFLLYAMTLGVKRVHFEQVYGSNQAIWIPCNNGSSVAQTHSGYYALITASEFIGGTSGNTKVQQITPSGNDGSTLSAYVAYNGNTPNRVALLNLNYWDQSQTGVSRGQPKISVSGIPSTLSSVKVEYLTNPGGAAQNADQTTFGGSQWPYSTLGMEKTGVQNTTTSFPVSGGVASVTVPYSSIAIVYLS